MARIFVLFSLLAAAHQVWSVPNPSKNGATPETPIYFSVSLSAPVDVLANTTILYDAILLNEGGMYSPEYGIFTCPVTGIYHFMLSAKADAFSSAQTQLVIDDGTVKTIVVSAMANDGYEHATNQAYVSCTIGNQVYVQGGAYGGRLYDAPGSQYNIFGGSLKWVTG